MSDSAISDLSLVDSAVIEDDLLSVLNSWLIDQQIYKRNQKLTDLPPKYLPLLIFFLAWRPRMLA
jgi:hypothetical protein